MNLVQNLRNLRTAAIIGIVFASLMILQSIGGFLNTSNVAIGHAGFMMGVWFALLCFSIAAACILPIFIRRMQPKSNFLATVSWIAIAATIVPAIFGQRKKANGQNQNWLEELAKLDIKFPFGSSEFDFSKFFGCAVKAFQPNDVPVEKEVPMEETEAVKDAKTFVIGRDFSDEAPMETEAIVESDPLGKLFDKYNEQALENSKNFMAALREIVEAKPTFDK